MFKIVTCVVTLIIINSVIFAQSDTGGNPFLNDANGRPLYMKSNYTAEGSPFLFDDYLPATLITLDGRIYTNVITKINLVDKEIYYRLPDGKEMVSTTPIKEVVFKTAPVSVPGIDSVLLTASNGPINEKNAAAYIVYANGKISVFKKVNINYKDIPEYGNTNMVRTFTRKESFEYSKDNAAPLKIPRREEDVLQLMNDRRKEVEQFIHTNNVKVKNDTQLVQLFRYYNSLFKSN